MYNNSMDTWGSGGVPMLHIPSFLPALRPPGLLGVSCHQERMGWLKGNLDQRLEQVAAFLLCFFCKLLKGCLGG